MNTFDPNFIDNTNEELMRYYFVKLADPYMGRREAELLFRNKWDIIRKFGTHRVTVFNKMEKLIKGS
jgi:hypothetical protein